MENKLISTFVHNRDAYDELRPRLDLDTFSDAGRLVVNKIEEYYNLDPEASYVDKDILKGRLAEDFPKKEEFFNLLIDGLEDVSVPNIVEEYKRHEIKTLSSMLGAELLASGMTQDAKDILKRIDELENAVEEDDEEIFIGEVSDIVESFDSKNLIHLYPESLDNAVGGGVPPGTHIIVFARPEQGKSLFTINLASEFLMQGLRVLYFGNEDPHQAMRMRFLNRLTRMTKHEVISQPDVAYDLATGNGYDNLIFVGRADVHVDDVKRIAEKYNPDCIVVDQMRNLNTGNKRLSKVESLEYIAQTLRKTYKQLGAVGVSVTQAGDSAQGKKILTMGDVDFSNTGIPATGDVMIGIGSDEMMEAGGWRFATLCKNKPNNDHSSLSLRFIPQYSEVLDG